VGSSPNTGARGVLLLCQSQETLEALTAILTHGGETVIAHRDLPEAWEHVQSGKAGCVVLEAQAPAVDAWAFFRAVRTTAKTCGLPFLFLISGDMALPQFNSFGPELAPDAWLLLPCAAAPFLNQVRALLAHNKRPRSGRSSSGRLAAVPPEAALEKSGQPGQMAVSPDELLARPGAVFAGNLGVLDVPKVVSMLEPLRLTGTLRLTDGKRCGEIHFVAGTVQHAELHEMEGANALFLLFHLKSGAFRFDLAAATTKRTVEGNNMSLLLEGMRQMDEAKALVKSLKQRPAEQTK